jgi:hypothetical protein
MLSVCPSFQLLDQFRYASRGQVNACSNMADRMSRDSGPRGSSLVEALRYKSEGRGFENGGFYQFT